MTSTSGRLLNLLAVLALAATQAGGARADGGFVAPYGYPVWEPGQTAFLHHDAAAGIEELSILPRFYGEPTDFAWIVPVPSLPEVWAADPELFRQLSALTAPVYRSRDGFWDCASDVDYLAGDARPTDGGVEIIDDQVIGIYRTLIVTATEADALTDSLDTWGFLHEGNRAAVLPVLEDYVDEGWYFVAMSVDSAAVAGAGWPYGKAATSLDAPWYYYPTLQPMTFRFASAQAIYPLRISQVSAPDASLVNLYVATGHRVDFPGARTLYANRLEAREHAAVVAAYPAAGVRLDAGQWLTRLSRDYTAPQMAADLILLPAATQTEVRTVHYSGLPVWTTVFGVSVGWWVVRRWRRAKPDAPKPVM